MRKKSPSERLPEVLGESPVPVPTMDLVALCLPPGKANGRQLVWAAMRQLGGLAEKTTERRAERSRSRVAYWRLATPPSSPAPPAAAPAPSPRTAPTAG